MKQETLEEYIQSLFTNEDEDNKILFSSLIRSGAKWQQEQDKNKYSEEEMLKMLHKFGFDYTYNYKGEKTIYEWIPEWFEEYKRLEQLNKQDMIITITNKDGLNQISKFSENKIKHITETNQWGYVINTILKNSNK
jgi:hypothetical protein